MLNIHEVIQRPRPEELLTPELRWQAFRGVFAALRDIPYGRHQSASQHPELNGYLEDFLARRKGTCTSKHLLLGLACESIGMGVRYLAYQFYWQNLPVEYPAELRPILKEIPAQVHTALAVLPDNEDQGKLYVIDCTWDQSLISADFPVNSLRGVPHHCDLGVIPHTFPILHHSATEQWTYLQKIKSAMPPNKSVPLFYDKFDEWLVSLRSPFTSSSRQDNNSFPNVAHLLLTAVA